MVARLLVRSLLSDLGGLVYAVAVLLMLPFEAVAEPVFPPTSSSAIEAYSTDANNSYALQVMNSQAQRASRQAPGSHGVISNSITLESLPGDEVIAGTNKPLPLKIDEKIRQDDQFQIQIPPMRGLTEMTNAAPVKDMFLQLSTTQVAILGQTMAQVENGAANGFFASMGLTSGLMQNTLQAHDMQLKLLDLTDRSGVQTHSYVNQVQKAFEKTQSWPAALAGALDDDPAKAKKVAFTQVPAVGVFTLANLPGPPPAKDSDGFIYKKLSDMIFYSPQAELAYQQELERKKQDFIRFLGDYWVGEESIEASKDKSLAPGRRTRTRRVRPQYDNQGRTGLTLQKWKEQVLVFESLGVILSTYCDLKRGTLNADTKIWDKQLPATALRTAVLGTGASKSQMSAWEYASSPDIPLSQDFVDQIYESVMRSSRVASNLECQALKVTAKQIPAEGDTFDKGEDCSVNKGCLRNKLLWSLSEHIGHSRALNLYWGVINQASKLATDPATRYFLDKIILEDFNNYNFEHQIQENRERFEKYKQVQAKLAKGESGGSSFIANMDSNNPSNFVAGR